jgi:hypothetical protein
VQLTRTQSTEEITMRTFLKAASTVALTLATVVTTGAVGTAAAHADDPRCVGFPSIPATYLCVVSVTPENALPSTAAGPTVIVPAFCYVIGCQPDTPVPTTTVVPSDQPVLVFTYNGQTYEIPSSGPLVNLDQAATALNGALATSGTKVTALCRSVAAAFNTLGLGDMRCAG